MAAKMECIDDVLAFWFGTPDEDNTDYQSRRKLWFRKNPHTDEEIRNRFRGLYDRAASGEIDPWQETPEGALALIIVLDQFPRNMFRNDPQAFATDAKALEVGKGAIARHFDQQLPPIQRIFIYIPLEHSENLEDQRQSVHLFGRLIEDCPELTDAYDYAVRHKEVIEAFGRFPHRNKILGRSTTASEATFLQQPGSSF